MTERKKDQLAREIRDNTTKAREAIANARHHLSVVDALMREDGQDKYIRRSVNDLSTAIDVLTRFPLLQLERNWDDYYRNRVSLK
jgi:hypothetical protein